MKMCDVAEQFSMVYPNKLYVQMFLPVGGSLIMCHTNTTSFRVPVNISNYSHLILNNFKKYFLRYKIAKHHHIPTFNYTQRKVSIMDVRLPLRSKVSDTHQSISKTPQVEGWLTIESALPRRPLQTRIDFSVVGGKDHLSNPNRSHDIALAHTVKSTLEPSNEANYVGFT